MPNIMTEEKIEHLIKINAHLKKHRKSRHIVLEMIDKCPKCEKKGQLTVHFIKSKYTWSFDGFSVLHRSWPNGKLKRWHCWLGKSLTGRISPRIIGPMAFCSKCKKWKSLRYFKSNKPKYPEHYCIKCRKEKNRRKWILSKNKACIKKD